VSDDLVPLPDGRQAQIWYGGAADGPAVLFCHGCPDTRWAARTGERAAREVGVRLLCVNRPGYGRSDAHPSTMTSVADDAVAVADTLGIDDFGVLGMSVGGAYAAALAARHADRVPVLGLVATPAMTSTTDDSETVEAAMTRHRPGFEEYVAGIAPEDPDDRAVAARFLAGLPAPDAALLRARTVEDVTASVREALANHDGYLRDAALLFRDWGYRVEDVTASSHLWYGADDDRNPPAVGAWWAERLTDSRVVVRPGSTHLATLLDHWPDVLGTLTRYLD
jgi:pimeloyl-ACP methyl ester carboxylesterase